MKKNRRFWQLFLLGVVLVILGYFGFMTFAPDKTSGSLMALVGLSVLVFVSGLVLLVAAVAFAIAKGIGQRKRP